jgi:hypothetical protein
MKIGGGKEAINRSEKAPCRQMTEGANFACPYRLCRNNGATMVEVS